jgi:hypothetical protein
MISLDNLEKLYGDLLSVVRREVTKMLEQDEIDDKQFRQLSEADKIVRAALERYESKKPKSPFEAVGTEDLMKDFE